MRRLLTIVVFAVSAIALFAQSLPSQEEINRILNEGPGWEIMRLKYRLLSEREKYDSTSVDYQIYSLYLLTAYVRLEDTDATKEIANSLYSFLQSGGQKQFRELWDDNSANQIGTIVLSALMNCYSNEGDYLKASEIGEKCLTYAKQLGDSQYYSSLQQFANMQHNSGRNDLAYKNIKKCFKLFDNTELFPGDITRDLINSTYFSIIHDLIIEAAKKGQSAKIKRYIREAESIYDLYPETNAALFNIDYDLISSIVDNYSSNTSQHEMDSVIEFLLNLSYTGYMANSDILSSSDHYQSANDYYASFCIGAAQIASKQNQNSISNIYFRFAEKYATHQDVSARTKGNILNYRAHYDFHVSGDYLDALQAYRTQINIQKETGDETIYNTFWNLLCLLEEATYASRCFYTHTIGSIDKQETEEFIPVLPTKDVNLFLDAWDEVSADIVKWYGDDYLESLLHSFHDLPANQFVFTLYSADDIELLRAHCYIREKEYGEAFSIISSLISRNVLSVNQIINLLSEITDNLYLHSGYHDAADFLSHVHEASFYTSSHKLEEWMDHEKEKVGNWFAFANGYAHSLAEEGEIGEAMKEYDRILQNAEYVPNRDSLYLEIQSMRSLDLIYFAKDYSAALPVLHSIDSLSQIYLPNDIIFRTNALSNEAQCFYYLGDFDAALESITKCQIILDKHPTEKDRILSALWLKCQILADSQELLSARESLSTLLSLLSDYHIPRDDAYYALVTERLARVYYELIVSAIRQDDPSCADLFYEVADILEDNKDVPDGYDIHLGPFKDFHKDIIHIIDSENVSYFCDRSISLDRSIRESEYIRGESSLKDYIERHTEAIGAMGRFCLEACYYPEAISCCKRAIDFGSKYPDQAREAILRNSRLLSIAYQENHDWVNSIRTLIVVFKDVLGNNGTKHKQTKDAFRNVKVSIDNALAASTSVAIAFFNDEMHPHLSYEENVSILSDWRTLLQEISSSYGHDYTLSLQQYCRQEQEISYRKQYGTNPPETMEEKLTYESATYYSRALLDIMANNLEAFSNSYHMLLNNITPYSTNEDIDQLRYDLVREMSHALEDAGYSDWSKNVLYDYVGYLASEDHRDYGRAEKTVTVIGNLAWRMKDMESLAWANQKALLVREKMAEPPYYTALFYDINELIQQLILLSRGEGLSDGKEARNTLLFAKELFDNNVSLSNGRTISDSTKKALFAELGDRAIDSDERIKYYSLATENDWRNNIATQIKLAREYTEKGDYEQSDSLLVGVLQLSKEEYMNPLWKSILYETVMLNAILSSDFSRAQEYSRDYISVVAHDYLTVSQSLTTGSRMSYWDQHYSNTLYEITSIDLMSGDNAFNAYNASLLQKNLQIRQKQSIRDNILESDDVGLKKAFDLYNKAVRTKSDSASVAEKYCMYLYSLHPEFVGAFQIPDWQDVRSSLSRTDLAIEYSTAYDLRSGKRYYVALILGKDYSHPVIVRLCEYDELNSLAMNNRDEKGFSMGLYDSKVRSYELLWLPIEPYLKGVKTIYYAPYDYLHNINHEIATKKDGGKTIGDLFTLHRLTSTADLSKHPHEHYNHAAIFGNIDYNAKLSATSFEDTLSNESNNTYSDLRGSMGGSWKYLPNTKTEMEDIQRQLNDKSITTSIFDEDRGSEEAFKSMSGDAPDILHMATHGYYFTPKEAARYHFFNSSVDTTDNPGTRSGLVLSGGNHVWNGEPVPIGSEDGILTADEICGMDLTETSLLTLSACQTALGDLTSEGVYGIQRSFKIAGARSIMMSLWEVHDEATYLMMDRFYQELAKGTEQHEAFRLAQSFIRQWANKRVKELKKEIASLPDEVKERKEQQFGGLLYPEYYWAAFIMLD